MNKLIIGISIVVLILIGIVIIAPKRHYCSIPTGEETFYTIEDDGSLSPAIYTHYKTVEMTKCPRIDETAAIDYQGPVPEWADEAKFRATGRLYPVDEAN